MTNSQEKSSLFDILKENTPIYKTFENTEEFAQYFKDNNIDLDLLLKAINQEIETPYNVYSEIYTRGKNMKSNELLEEYRDIKAENKIIYNKIESMKWLLTILVTVFGIFTPLIDRKSVV